MRLKSAILATVLATSLALTAPSPAQPPPGFHPESIEFLAEQSEAEALRRKRAWFLGQREYEALKREALAADPSQRPEYSRRLARLKDKVKSQLVLDLTPGQLASVNGLSPDPRERRYQFRARVLKAPNLSRPQNGALISLLEESRKLCADFAQDQVQFQTLERGFWELASLILSVDQMVAVKKQLPYHYQTIMTPDNFKAVPGLTDSQANRLLAAFMNFEAENTATQVRLHELQARLEHSEGQQTDTLLELAELRIQLLEAKAVAKQDLIEQFTPDQVRLLDSAPPIGSLTRQDDTARWLTERQTEAQRTISQGRLTQLHSEYEQLLPSLKALKEEYPDREDNARGALMGPVSIQRLIRPFLDRRLALAREIAPLLEKAQIKEYLMDGLDG